MGYTRVNWQNGGPPALSAEPLNQMDKGIKEAMPTGGIIMWSGAVSAIPEGWAICDGNNGTPDLYDRFIVGAGSSYNPGTTGGQDTVTLTESEMPSHNHYFSDTTSTDGSHTHDIPTWSHGTNRTGDRIANAGGSSSGSVTTDSLGSHNHSVSGYTNNEGSSQSHENRPPFYALAFIMKL